MTTLTPRLEIASRIAQGMVARNGYDSAWIAGRAVGRALEIADALIALDSQAGADASEMARTIQRLEGRVNKLRSCMGNACNMIEAYGYQQARNDLSAAIDADTEAAT